MFLQEETVFFIDVASLFNLLYLTTLVVVQLSFFLSCVGEIVLKDLTLAYAHELPPAVKDVTVNIKAGEKIGVCGRTGSGKSTITLGLFRMLQHFEGQIVIDGIDISQMSLRPLRSRLAIIPQDPILFQGTVRFNLDPRGVHEDDALWHALEVAQLKNAITALSGGLEGAIVEGEVSFFLRLTVFIQTHPVNFPCWRKPERPEKTHDFRQSVD